jgi:hypothetical protein
MARPQDGIEHGRSTAVERNLSAVCIALIIEPERPIRDPGERQHFPAVVLRAKEFSEAVKVEHIGSPGATPRLSRYLWPKTWLIATGWVAKFSSVKSARNAGTRTLKSSNTGRYGTPGTVSDAMGSREFSEHRPHRPPAWHCAALGCLKLRGP